MNCYEVLGVLPGVTSVVGSGGKTTLLSKLSQEVRGMVVLTTSTHILPFPNMPLLENPALSEVKDALTTHRVHRSKIFCDRAGCSPDDPATPERIAMVIAAEHASGAVQADVILANQAKSEKDLALARDFTQELRLRGDSTPVVAGSLFNSTFAEMCDR